MNPFDECKTISCVKSRWKSLAQQYHPDKGGDVLAFQELKEQYNEAISKVSKPRNCEVCEGRGKYHTQRGFHMIMQRCNVCHGTGKIKP